MATVFKIEKGIPIPADARQRKYPFLELEVGDSFFVDPGDGETAAAARVKVAGTARYYRDRSFVVRRYGRGVRVWRIA